jgi:hypothetical protein
MGIRLIAICIFLYFFHEDGADSSGRSRQTSSASSAAGENPILDRQMSGWNFFEAGLEAAELSY